jgi:cell division protein FtsN
MSALLYVVVEVPDEAMLARVRRAAARPWLTAYRLQVRYWAGTPEEAEAERTALALAGIESRIENSGLW